MSRLVALALEIRVGSQAVCFPQRVLTENLSRLFETKVTRYLHLTIRKSPAVTSILSISGNLIKARAGRLFVFSHNVIH